MMVVNAVFLHLIATIVLKRYAPGTITGIISNAPVGIYILKKEITSVNDLMSVIAAGAVVSLIIIFMIKYLFLAGKRFIR